MLNIQSLGRLFKQEHSYEDTHNLLEILLLISDLPLAFEVERLKNLGHDDLMKEDARHLALLQDPVFLVRYGRYSLDDQQRFLGGKMGTR